MTDQRYIFGAGSSSDTVVYRWWVTAPVNLDVYWVFVTRARTENGKLMSYEHLDPETGWTEEKVPGMILRPILELDGRLVYALSDAGALEVNRREVGKALGHLANQIAEAAGLRTLP